MAFDRLIKLLCLDAAGKENLKKSYMLLLDGTEFKF